MASTAQLYFSLEKAARKLHEARSFPNTEPMRESSIQRFEYTFELSWKTMSSILADENMPTAGVKSVIRAAAQLGLIEDPKEWLEFADARNQASHIYKEEVAMRVYKVAVGNFVEAVDSLLTSCKKYL